ncbi:MULTISPECIES: hypothetical protein [unclassified Sphaerospermopsis]|nr:MULTISPECIES: hypothetical protein [unclassified Sphaerospermopsis]
MSVNNFQLRNAIAHGFKTTSLTIKSVLELIEVTVVKLTKC